MRSVLIVVVVILYGSVPGLGQSCCPFKTVGSYNYSNVDHAGPVPEECTTSCAYIRDDQPSGPIYCFANGYQPSTCHGYTTPSTEGIIVAGGQSSGRSVEVFFPQSGTGCSLPHSLPHNRHLHTLDTPPGNQAIICGGGDTNASLKSCLYLPSPTSTWANLTTPLARGRHSQGTFINGDDLILIGGGISPSTSETVGTGIVNTAFLNGYDYKGGCSIQDGPYNVILTGGFSSPKNVSIYNAEGLVGQLPPLLEGRRNHGCGSYNYNGAKVYLVAGGYEGYSVARLDSTETLAAGASTWTTGGPLPRQLVAMAYVSGENLVYFLGGADGNGFIRSEVLKYENSMWIQLPNGLQRGRHQAAATIVMMDVNVCG